MTWCRRGWPGLRAAGKPSDAAREEFDRSWLIGIAKFDFRRNAAFWIVHRLFLVTYVINPNDMLLAIGALGIGLSSIAAALWLALHRR